MAVRQVAPTTSRGPAMSERARPLVIEPLTRKNWDPLAELFSAGGDPRWCWLQCTVGAAIELDDIGLGSAIDG